jgi:glycosyltransferase involved in cell wall biosynthesis
MIDASTPLLSVVVPIKDEIETLPELHRRLSDVLTGELSDGEIVFVDDGSGDGSARWIAERHADDPRVKLVRLSRNFGHQAAVTAGLAHARGRAVVLMDGDLQDPPELIPALVDRWREGNEIVHTVKTRRQESWARRLAFRAFYRMIRSLSSETDLPLQAGLFSLLDRRVVDELERMPERNRYLAGLRAWVGFRQTAVEYERDARWSGAPRVSVARLFRLAFDGIFSFSNLPLRLATLLGLVVSLAAFLLMATILYLRLFTDRAILGWASLMTSILFLGGVILVTIGIIGEYTGRIYDEVKRRPLYVVAERIGVSNREHEIEDRRL